jgi:hypothetical protein
MGLAFQKNIDNNDLLNWKIAVFKKKFKSKMHEKSQVGMVITKELW